MKQFYQRNEGEILLSIAMITGAVALIVLDLLQIIKLK
jgi:hypothetical protein